MRTFSWKVSVFYAVYHGLWLKRIIAAVTGTSMYVWWCSNVINKDCRVLFGNIFIVPFLSSALGYLIFDSNVQTANFWKMSNLHPMPCLPPSRRLYIDRYIMWSGRLFHGIGVITEKVRFPLITLVLVTVLYLRTVRFLLGMYLSPVHKKLWHS